MSRNPNNKSKVANSDSKESKESKETPAGTKSKAKDFDQSLLDEEYPIGKDGKRDFLKQDPPLGGQTWVCLSFVSPEDMIVKKELMYMNEFLVRDINKTLKDEATHMVKELTRVFNEQIEPIIDRYKASVNESDRQIGKHLEETKKKCLLDETNFANRCLHLYAIDGDEIHDKYKIFKVQASDELDKKFDKENNYRTSVRGLKVRGVFNDRRDADDRAKLMREHEPLSVYVAPVGQWLPWDPDPDAIQDSDYMLPQLNELMKKYHDNVRDKNKHFEERKREMMENANLSNAEKKRKQLLKKLTDRKKALVDKELAERQKELLDQREKQKTEQVKKLENQMEERKKLKELKEELKVTVEDAPEGMSEEDTSDTESVSQE